MTLSDLYQLYKAWKQVKGVIDQVKGSGAAKILDLSGQVDRLIKEYSAWKDKHSDDLLALIKTKLQNIKAELFRLATATPAPPKVSKDMALDYAKEVLETSNTAQMARSELMRISVEQLNEDLPSEDLDRWPSTRARLLNGAEAYSRMAVGFRSQVFFANRDLAEAQRVEGELRDVQKISYLTQEEIDQVEHDYQEWHNVEIDIKDRQSRLEAMAKVADQSAANIVRLVEAGDVVHKEYKAKK